MPGLLLGAVVSYRAGLVLALRVVAALVVERDEVLGRDSIHFMENYEIFIITPCVLNDSRANITQSIYIFHNKNVLALINLHTIFYIKMKAI